MSLHVHPEIEQGTPEWHAQRRGIVTASVVRQLVTTGSPDPAQVECPACGVDAGPCLSISRKTPTLLKTVHSSRSDAANALPPVHSVAQTDTSRGLTATLVAERLTGFTEETPMSADMWRGVEDEPRARDKYAEHYAPVTQVGFMVRDDWGFKIGFSPDGLVGDDGLLEIKSRRPKKHLQTILADEVPAENLAQCQAGLLVSGRDWLDFVSYSGGMPLFVKRVYPDQKWFDAIIQAVTAFEDNAVGIFAAYSHAIQGLPMTERAPDLETMVI